MRPREWVAVHRKHHAATDTADDPHSPLVVGFWRVQLGNVGLYKRAAPRRRDRAQVRARHPARPPRPARVRLRAPRARRSASRSSSSMMWALGFGLLTGFLAAGLHAVLYVMLVGRDQRGRPPVRQAAVRELGDEPAIARARHRRRGLAQQPSRRAHVGALLAASRRARSRLVVRARARRAAPRARAPRRRAPEARRVATAIPVVVYVAMLRGINVGGTNRMKMPALAALFAGLGHTDVVTYIQSGNVVFKSRRGARRGSRRRDRAADRPRLRLRRSGRAPHEGGAHESDCRQPVRQGATSRRCT